MRTRSRFLGNRSLFLPVIIAILGTASAQDDALVLEFFWPKEHVFIQDKSEYFTLSCEPHHTAYFAGSSYVIGILYTPREVREARSLCWPEGYLLEGALDIGDNACFVPTAGLIERLTPTVYWAQVPSNRPHARDDPDDLNFALHIPEDLAGHTIDFHLCYETSDSLSEIQSHRWKICIFSPNDEYDSARIVASQIFEAFDMSDYYRVAELADSMLARGLTDAYGWVWAMLAAEHTDRYDRALTYLERLWEDFGVSAVNLEGHDFGRPQRPTVPSQYRQQLFEQKRNALIKWKAEYQQHQR